MLAVPRISRDDRTGQGVAHSWSEAVFLGPMIVQIFMQWRCHGMLHRRFYTVRCKAGAHSLTEAGRSAAPLSRLTANLRNAGPSRDACNGGLAER
jgi:hypothetical protein